VQGLAYLEDKITCYLLYVKTAKIDASMPQSSTSMEQSWKNLVDKNFEPGSNSILFPPNENSVSNHPVTGYLSIYYPYHKMVN